MIPEPSKRRRDCGELKALSNFPPAKKRSDGRASYCRACMTMVDQLLAVQGGKCAGCGKPDPEHVDHDHVTGKVRGLLCFNCNQALGNVRDDLIVLGRLQDYLLRHLRVPDPRPPVETRLREVIVEAVAGGVHAGGTA